MVVEQDAHAGRSGRECEGHNPGVIGPIFSSIQWIQSGRRDPRQNYRPVSAAGRLGIHQHELDFGLGRDLVVGLLILVVLDDHGEPRVAGVAWVDSMHELVRYALADLGRTRVLLVLESVQHHFYWPFYGVVPSSNEFDV